MRDMQLWVQKGWAVWVGPTEIKTWPCQPLYRYANPSHPQNTVVSKAAPAHIRRRPDLPGIKVV